MPTQACLQVQLQPTCGNFKNTIMNKLFFIAVTCLFASCKTTTEKEKETFYAPVST